MAVNDFLPASSVRVPVFTVLINQVPVLNFKTIKVIQNSHYTSDRFELEIPLYGQPNGINLDFWHDLTDAELQIVGAIQNGASQQLVIGPIDEVVTRLMAGTVKVTGRDYSGALIETRIYASSYLNMTSTGVAAKIAAEHGLDVSTPQQTTTQIGVYYEDANRTLTSYQLTEWDLLTALADREGFVVEMQGRVLYFGPKPAYNDDAYVIAVNRGNDGPPTMANVGEIELSRSMTWARDIVVKVESTNALDQKTYSDTEKAVNAIRTNRSGLKFPAQQYYFNIPGLDANGVKQRAVTILSQLSQSEKLMSIEEMPGDPLMTMKTPIKLIGTGSGWDQTYYADEIVHMYGVEEGEGWKMSVRAKNHDTQSSVPL